MNEDILFQDEIFLYQTLPAVNIISTRAESSQKIFLSYVSTLQSSHLNEYDHDLSTWDINDNTLSQEKSLSIGNIPV